MKKSIALVTTIMMAALLTVLVGTAMFLASKAIFVTGGEERFASAFEAAEGGIEKGIWKVKKYLLGEDVLSAEEIKIASYNVKIDPKMIGVFVRSGFNLRFAAAYLGLGYSEKGGGVGQIFLILSDAIHPRGQRGIVEVLKMVPTGIKGGG